MKKEVYARFKDSKKNHCWQYEIRQQNLIKDLQEAELTQEEYNNLRIEDFEFSYVDKTNKYAQKVYNALGMSGEHYDTFEWTKK